MEDFVSKRHRGFTIVELLIVIVVIAILAALSVVAYTNIQTRAKNTTKASAVQQAVKLIQLYKTGEGTYPRSTAGGEFCLTTDNVCTNYAGVTNGAANTALMNELKEFGTPSAQSGDTVVSGGRYGIVYNYLASRTLSSQPNPALVMFFLDGTNQMCAGLIGGMVSVTDDGTGNFVPGNRSSGDTGGKTRCYVMFPN